MRKSWVKMWLAVIMVALTGTGFLMPSGASAQNKPGAKPTAVPARPPVGGERPARDITMVGRLVSIHYAMAGPAKGDENKAISDSLRAGGAAALESPGGLIVLGQGNTGGVRLFSPLAGEQVEVQGRLHEKSGLKYIDVATIHGVEEPGNDEEAPEEDDGD